MKLTNTEILFIRACKADNSNTAMLAVLRRFYCTKDNSDQRNINILVDIFSTMIVKYFPDVLPLDKFIHEVNKTKDFYRIFASNIPEATEADHYLLVLSNALRFTSKDMLLKVGYRVPRKFRND